MDMSNIDYEPWKAVRMIGTGSFGSVYEVQREEFGEIYKAALKVISIPRTEDEIRNNRADGMDDQSMTSYYSSVVKELTHEFSLLSKMAGNTNVVSYADHKVVPHENGIGWDIYIRMELLTSLTEISSVYNFSRDEVVKLGMDICNALILCEKQNIIHRDIKPDNIFVSDNGDFKLGDFGIARTASRTMSNMSRKGTPNYMAPEVYRDQPYNHTADIYSLGIVLYQLMNGKRLPFIPFNMTIQDREAALGRRISGEALPFPEMADPEFARIILRACAFDPNQRYRDAEEMKRDLMELLNGNPEQSLDMPYIMGLVRKEGGQRNAQSSGTMDNSGFGQNANGSYGMNGRSVNTGVTENPYGTNNGAMTENPYGMNNGMTDRNPYGMANGMNGNIPYGQQVGNNSGSGNSGKVAAFVEKNKKILMIAGGVVAVWLLLSVVGRVLSGSGSDSTETASVTVEEPQPVETTTDAVAEDDEVMEEVAEEDSPSNNSGSQLTDDLNDFIFEMEGYTYKLPVSYQDFKATGWELYSRNGDQTEDTEISANSYEYCYMTNGAVDINVQIYNASGNVKTIKDCNIGEIEVEAKDNLDFAVAKGITCTSTDDEITEAFGSPSSSNDNETYKNMTYRKGDSRYDGETQFYIDKEHSTNNKITITYMPTTTDDVTEVSGEIPEYLASYKAPTGLSDDATDTIFELDGKIYQLPCPVSEFTEAGWSIASKDVDSVGAQNKSGYLGLEKSGYRIRVSTANYDKEARLIENCAVYSVYVETNYKSTAMKGDYAKFSGGINLDLSYSNADSALNGFDKNDSDSYVSYSYYSGSTSSVRYYWSKDVDYPNMNVTLRNENWEY